MISLINLKEQSSCSICEGEEPRTKTWNQNIPEISIAFRTSTRLPAAKSYKNRENEQRIMGIKTAVHSGLFGLLCRPRKHMALSVHDVLFRWRLFPHSIFLDASVDRTTWSLLRNGCRTRYSAGTGTCDRSALPANERFVAWIISEMTIMV